MGKPKSIEICELHAFNKNLKPLSSIPDYSTINPQIVKSASAISAPPHFYLSSHFCKDIQNAEARRTQREEIE